MPCLLALPAEHRPAAFFSCWTIAPLAAKFGQFGCGQLIEVNKPLPFRPGLQLRLKKESAFAIAVFAQMPRLFIITKTLDRICNRDPGARFRFVRIGCIFEIARCELRFFSQLRVLAAWRIILPSSSVPLYPFGAEAAPMIDIRVLAGRVMTRVNREHFRSPLSVGCTIFVRFEQMLWK